MASFPLIEGLCQIIEDQARLLRRMAEVLAQHQAVDEYEAAMARSEKKYAALTGGEAAGRG